MTAYMISQVEVLDDAQWRRYEEIAAPATAQYGGRYLVQGHPEVAEGDWTPQSRVDPPCRNRSGYDNGRGPPWAPIAG